MFWNLRLWRRKKIGPGLHVNLSKSGPSLSIGPRGAKVTIGRRGIRQTVGIPGTGLFATKQTGWGATAGRAGAGRSARNAPTARASLAPASLDTWLPVPMPPAITAAGAGGAVPRTQAEAETLLARKPPAWEYLYFAALIRWGRDELEPRFAALTAGDPLPSGEAVGDADAPDFLTDAMDQLQASIKTLDLLFAPARTERAFGPPGTPGDAGAIGQLAAHWTAVYRSLIDCVARLNSAAVSPRFKPVFAATARIALQPAVEYHDYVDHFVSTIDDVPARLASAQPVRLDLMLRLNLDDAALADLDRAMRAAIGSPSPGFDPAPWWWSMGRSQQLVGLILVPASIVIGLAALYQAITGRAISDVPDPGLGQDLISVALTVLFALAGVALWRSFVPTTHGHPARWLLVPLWAIAVVATWGVAAVWLFVLTFFAPRER